MTQLWSNSLMYFYGGFDLSPHTIRGYVSLKSAALDVTGWNQGAEQFIRDIRKDTIEWAGYFDDAGTALNAAIASLGTSGKVVTVLLGTGAGAPAYAGTAIWHEYKTPGRLGEVAKLDGGWQPEGAFGRGVNLVSNGRESLGSGIGDTGNPVDNSVLSTAGGTFFIHAFVAGTRDIVIQSATTATGAYTSHGTIHVNTVDSYVATVAGTINRFTRFIIVAPTLDGTINFAAVFVRG